MEKTTKATTTHSPKKCSGNCKDCPCNWKNKKDSKTTK